MQFIPRLSSTSINNKHLHETRASLGGWRRHRPARSTSDETLLSAQHRICFPQDMSSVAETPGHNLYLCLLALIKAAVLSALTETPQCLQRWQRAPVAHDKRQTLSSEIPLRLWCALFLSIRRPCRHVIDVWCSVCDMTRCRGGVVRELGEWTFNIIREYCFGCLQMQCILFESFIRGYCHWCCFHPWVHLLSFNRIYRRSAKKKRKN